MNKKHSLLYFIFTISGLSLLSKVLGLFREGVVAAYFGTTAETDVYFYVYSIFMSLIAVTLTPVAISYLPIFVSKRNEEGEQKAVNHFTKLLQQFFVVSFVIALCVNIFFCFVSAFGIEALWNKEEKDCVFYIRLFALMFFFAGSIQIFSSVLNGIKQYGKFQIATMLQNVVIILFVLLFGKSLGVRTLVFAVMIGYVIQFVYMVFELYLRRKNKIVLSERMFCDKELTSVYKSMIPVALGAETYLVGLTIDKIIGRTLEIEGAVSALNYSGLLYGLVNTVIIMAVVTVYYTEFAEIGAKKGRSAVFPLLDDAILNLSFILLPIAVFLSFCANDFISVVLKRGEFSEHSVLLTAIPFAIYILNSPIYAIRSLITRVFYVFDDIKIPMYNGLIYIGLNVLFGIVFSRLFGLKGITLAALLASCSSCVFLFFNLKKRMQYQLKLILLPLLKISLSALVAWLICFVCSIEVSNSWLSLVVNGTIFLSVYVIILLSLRFERLFYVWAQIKIRIRKR